MKKRICALQVTPSEPNSEHVNIFNSEDSDFYFVTHDKENSLALKFCPNTTWVDTRNILAEMVPREYEYYAFVDYDYVLRPQRKKGALGQILEDLDSFEPAVLTYYPGNGLITPFATDKDYYQSCDYSIIPFTHCGLKIVHHSLMDWFFPMVTKFGGGVEACHFFNILEIPFLKHVVCSHKMIYDNGITNMDTPHNKDAHLSKLKMDKMWSWVYPYFNKRCFLRDHEVENNWADNIPHRIEEYTSYTDSLKIKDIYVQTLKGRVPPVKSATDVNYLDPAGRREIERFFDINHEHFTSVEKDLLIVVGNGPSLKKEFFDVIKEMNIDTFGLNSAYRYFEEMGWYPKYYGCFDYALAESHKEEWSSMILDEGNPIEKYFLLERPSIEANLPHTSLYFSDTIRKHPKFVERPHNQDGLGHPYYGTRNNKISCTGANAVRTGVELGYKKIILIGHDANYIQSSELEEASHVEGCRYEVNEEFKDNPNYFWDDYQKKGDLFHNPGSPVNAWHKLGECLSKFAPDVEVVNCSEGSSIQCFRFGDFYEEILKKPVCQGGDS